MESKEGDQHMSAIQKEQPQKIYATSPQVKEAAAKALQKYGKLFEKLAKN